MSKRRRNIIILVSLLFVSCVLFFIFSGSKRKDRNLFCVPKNAAVTVKLNMPQLIDKADIMQLMMSNGLARNKFLAMIFDVAGSGIDMDESVYGFITRENEETFIGISLALSDKEKFLSWLKEEIGRAHV